MAYREGSTHLRPCHWDREDSHAQHPQGLRWAGSPADRLLQALLKLGRLSQLPRTLSDRVSYIPRDGDSKHL